MKIIEKLIKGKFLDQTKCEDALVISNNYLAVIDGATAKGKKRINRMRSGKAIAECISNYLINCDCSFSGDELITNLSLYIKEVLLQPNKFNYSTLNSPSAAVAIYTIKQRTITVVGDVSIVINKKVNRHVPSFDKSVSEVRSIVNWLAKESHINILSNKEIDLGRSFILPLLRKQHRLRNIDTDNPWGYGNVDGTPVPSKYIHLYKVKKNQEVIFCSDGYPIVEDTLTKAETELFKVINEDPLQTFKHFSTKGMLNDQESFDDRTYLRFIS